MLKDKMREWTEAIDEAARELDAAILKARPGDKIAVAVDEGGLELDFARDELMAMPEARELLEGVSGQLDDAGRAVLARAVELLCSVDWTTRTDALAGEAARLRELQA